MSAVCRHSYARPCRSSTKCQMSRSRRRPKQRPDGRRNLVDNDRYDDGVTFFPLTFKPGRTGDARYSVCVADPNGGRYDGTPGRSLFVNGWIDWNWFHSRRRLPPMSME